MITATDVFNVSQLSQSEVIRWWNNLSSTERVAAHAMASSAPEQQSSQIIRLCSEYDTRICVATNELKDRLYDIIHGDEDANLDEAVE